MKERFVYFIVSLVFFLLLFLSFSHYRNSLDFNTKLESLSVMRIALASGGTSRVDLAPLNLGSRYIAVLRAGVESTNLHAYKLPYFRKAFPQLRGLVKYRTKSALEDYSSEIGFTSDILSRLSKTIIQGASGDFKLSVPITILSPVSSDDFLEVEIILEKGQMNSSILEIYKAESLRDLILFYPLLLAYASFMFTLFALGFLVLTFFGIPREHSVYSFLICIFFGLIGFDALIRGHSVKFLMKLLTLGGCGILYAFDLGKEFYFMVLKKP